MTKPPRSFLLGFAPSALKNLDEWRVEILNGVLHGIFIIWLFGLVSGINNIIHSYRSEAGNYENPLVLAAFIVSIFIALTALVAIITFNKKLPYNLRAGLFLMVLYLLGGIGLLNSSLSGDGRIFFFALIALAAILLNLRAGFLALGVSLITIIVVGWLQVNEIVNVPTGVQIVSTNPIAWVSGGIVFLVLAVAVLISTTFLLTALEKSIVETNTSLKREQRLSRILRTISSINQTIFRNQDSDKLLKEACELLVAGQGYSFAWIGLLDSDMLTLRLVAHAGDVINEEEFTTRLDLEEGLACAIQALRTRSFFRVESLGTDDPCEACPRKGKFPNRSAISLPLIRDMRVFGVLVVDHAEASAAFDDQEIALLEELADDLSYALEHIEASKKLDTFTRYQTLLNEVTQTALSAFDLDTLLKGYVEKLEAALDADGYYFAMWDESRKLPAKFMFSESFRQTFSSLPVLGPDDRFFTRSILEEERILAIPDIMDTPYINPKYAALFNIRSALGVPLIANQMRIGALVLGYKGYHVFTPEEMKLAEQSLHQFALAILKVKLNDEMRLKARELEQLYVAAQDMASSLLDPPALLEKLAFHMTESLEVTSANIMAINLPEGVMQVVGEYWSKQALPQEVHPDLGRIFPNGPYSTIMSAMLAGKVIVLHHDSENMTSTEREQFSDYGIKTMMFVPIMAHGQLFGDIELWESRERREFSETEIRLAQAMSGHAAGIIESSNLFAQTRQRELELEALLTIARAVSSSLQLPEVLEQAATTLARLLRVDFCSLSDYLPERNGIVTSAIFSADGDVSGIGDLGLYFSLDDYPATRKVLESGQPIVNRLDDSNTDPAEIKQLLHDEMYTSLIIPLRIRGQSLGLAELFSADPNRFFKTEEVQFACALADQVAVAIENARLYETIEHRESYFRVLIENSAEGFAIIDASGMIRYIAQSEVRLTGYTPEELVGGSAFTYIHPDDLPGVLKVFAEGVATPGAVRSIYYRLKRKDGEWRYFEITGHNMLDEAHIGGVVVNYRDITERKIAEQIIAESEARYRTIFQSAGVPIWEDDYSGVVAAIHDLKSQGVTDFGQYLSEHPEFIDHAAHLIKILDVNEAGVKLMEADDRSELIGALDEVLKENPSSDFILALADGATHYEDETHLLTLKGTRRDIWLSITMPHWSAGYEHVLVSTLDITERKQTERALLENQKQLSGIINTAPNGIITINASQRIVLFNPFAETIFGCSAEYAIGRPIEDFIPLRFRFSHGANVENYGMSKISDRKHGRLDSLYGLRANGGEFPMEAFISQYIIGEDQFFTVILRDITERKQAEEALKESEMRFRALAENIPSTVYICLNDERYTMIYLNDYVEALTGYSKEAFLEKGLSFFELYHPDDLELMPYASGKKEINKDAFHITYRIKHKNGDWRWVDEWGTGVYDQSGNIHYIEGVMIDITDRKRAEENLRRHTLELEILAAASSALRKAQNVKEIISILAVHAIQAVQAAYASVYLMDLEIGQFVSQGWYSATTLDNQTSANESELKLYLGQGITSHVVETGEAYITEDIQHDPDTLPLDADRDLLNGLHGISLPLRYEENIIGVIHVISTEARSFNETDTRLLTAIAEMGGNAIHRASLFDQTRHYADELSQAYDNTLAGWARALELRDELTEGHTRRVTELTLQLAREMKIPENELVQIRRGALLHDIGKMGIPDAILNKTGPLTAQERKIMQEHPQFAQDMLSTISFLQSAIDIPLYHHEHWNGGGYPFGLKGEEIPLAARIFTVVDVWDALTSDRPYRFAWPKQQTLDYIRAASGKQFDPQVVEKFLKLIENQ